MPDKRISYNEEMVGAGHPTKPDTLNRLAAVEHNDDGTHNKLTRVTDPWVDLRAYGATGDGAADDTAAVNAALASSKKIFIPAGTYLITGSTLAGSSNCHIYCAPGAVFKLAAAATSKNILGFNGRSNVVIDNITFDLNQAGAVSGIALQLTGGSNFQLNNCRIINSAATRSFPATAYGYGIYLLGAWENVRICNIYCADIMYGVITGPTSTGKNLVVSKGLMEYLEGDGVELNAPNGSCENVEVEGMVFSKLGSGTSFSRGFGVGMSGGVGTTVKRVNIHDNKFLDIVFQGVHVEDGCQQVDIHDNFFEGCGSSTIPWTYNNAIYVAATNAGKEISKVKIRGNTVNNPGTASNWGITCEGSVAMTDVEITGNYLNMNGVNGGSAPCKGILVASQVSRYQVIGNTVKNAANVGIKIAGAYGVVKGNICYDDQAVKTQTYGIEYTSGADYTIFAENILVGNSTGAFLAASVPDGARFINNIEAEDQIVGLAVSSSTVNTVGSYKIDGPIAYGQRRTVADAAHAMTRYDAYIAYTSLTAGRQVTLPVTNIQAGHEVIIKDEAGAAGTYNITMVPTSGTIDGAASVVISTNYGSKRFRWNGASWFTV